MKAQLSKDSDVLSLCGHFRRTINEKQRFRLPQEFAQATRAILKTDRVSYIAVLEPMESHIILIPNTDAQRLYFIQNESAKYLDHATIFLGAQNQMCIPVELFRKMNMDEDTDHLILHGKGHFIEIWPEKEWDADRQSLKEAAFYDLIQPH